MAQLLLLVLLLLHPLTGETKPHQRHRHERRVVVIEDRTSGDWAEAITETVAEFAPYRRLRLVTGEGGCDKGDARRVIICESDMAFAPPGALGYSSLGQIGVTSSDMILGPDLRENIVCHEFMHVFTGILDNYGARDDSCVWGYLPDLGEFDIELLERTAPKKGKP